MEGMRKMPFFPQNIISASRVSDLMRLVKSLNPDLVILCFRSNQMALNDFNSFADRPGIPLFCLTRKWETEPLSWNRNSIVFTYPLERIDYQESFSSMINSIFLLRPESSTKTTVNTFADAARQSDQGGRPGQTGRPDQSDQGGNNRNLSRYVMELDQKVEFLSKVKDRIAELYPRVDDRVRADLISIVNSIKMSAGDNKLWQDFKVYFEQISPGFLSLLSRKYPELTPIDLKYCCYLKMNMTNDDIRNLLGINQESVRTHKYRLKRKMSLSKEQDLTGYLRSVG